MKGAFLGSIFLFLGQIFESKSTMMGEERGKSWKMSQESVFLREC